MTMDIYKLVDTVGPAVLGPLKSGNSFVYYAAFNGLPLLKGGQWGKESSFSNEVEAMIFAERYAREAPQAQPLYEPS